MIWQARAAGAVALLATFALAAWWVYTSGYQNGRQDAERILVAAKLEAQTERADALAKLMEANARMVTIEADAAKRIQAAERRVVTRTQTVERVIREEPSFAAVVRPGDIDRVRDEQLAELVEAAERGADLSRRGFRGLRTADPVDGQKPGGD